MSWYVNLNNEHASKVEEAIDAAELPAEMKTPEHEQQFAVAKSVAKHLVRHEIVGHPAGYHVQMSGHANANHAKREGYANSRVQVAVEAAPDLPE